MRGHMRSHHISPLPAPVQHLPYVVVCAINMLATYVDSILQSQALPAHILLSKDKQLNNYWYKGYFYRVFLKDTRQKNQKNPKQTAKKNFTRETPTNLNCEGCPSHSIFLCFAVVWHTNWMMGRSSTVSSRLSSPGSRPNICPCCRLVIRAINMLTT